MRKDIFTSVHSADSLLFLSENPCPARGGFTAVENSYQRMFFKYTPKEMRRENENKLIHELLCKVIIVTCGPGSKGYGQEKNLVTAIGEEKMTHERNMLEKSEYQIPFLTLKYISIPGYYSIASGNKVIKGRKCGRMEKNWFSKLWKNRVVSEKTGRKEDKREINQETKCQRIIER